VFNGLYATAASHASEHNGSEASVNCVWQTDCHWPCVPLTHSPTGSISACVEGKGRGRRLAAVCRLYVFEVESVDFQHL